MISLPSNSTGWFELISADISCLKVSEQTQKPIIETSHVIFNDTCESICGEHSTVVADASVIESCLLYANISHYLTPNTTQSNSNFTDVSLLVSDLFVSDRPTNFTNSTRGDSLAQCMPELCQRSAACQVSTANTCTLAELLLPDGTIPVEAYLQCKDLICSRQRSINPDIAGIGVYISYFIQFALMLLFTIILIISVPVRCVCRGRIRAGQSRKKAQKGSKHIKSSDNKQKKLSKLATKWATSFQRNQYLLGFIMVLAIASTLNKARHHPDSLLSAADAQALVIITGFGVFSPTGFLFLLVITIGKVVSWFDFLATFVSWLMALGTVPYILGASTEYVSAHRALGSDCGETALAVYCPSTAWQTWDERLYFMTVPVMFGITVLWIVKKYPDQLRDHGGRLVSRIKKLSTLTKVLGAILITLSLVVGGVVVFFQLVARNQPIYALRMISSPVLWFSEATGADLRDGVSLDWSFGQVAAVVVWLPTFTEVLSDVCKLGWARCQKRSRRSKKQKAHSAHDRSSGKRDVESLLTKASDADSGPLSAPTAYHQAPQSPLTHGNTTQHQRASSSSHSRQ